MAEPNAEYAPEDGDQATCRYCNRDIEFDGGNEPPWTHCDDGYPECEPDDPEPSAWAEPAQNDSSGAGE